MSLILLDQYDIADMAQAAAEASLRARIVAVLERHYPGHLWKVHVDVRGNVWNLQLPYPEFTIDHVRSWGYQGYVSDFDTDPTLKIIVTGGGEMLERWGLMRRGWRPGDTMRAIANGVDRSDIAPKRRKSLATV